MARTSGDYTAVAHLYDETRGGEDRGRRIAAGIAPYLDPAAPVLDVGVGTGVVAQALRERGYAVYGVDVSYEMLRRALPRLGTVLVNGSADALPVPDRAFRQACSVWVLHAVADQAAVLAEISRVLRPGGRYVVVAGTILFGDDPISRILDQVQRRTNRNDDRADALAPLATAARLRVVQTAVLPPTRYDQSPAQVAEMLEDRTTLGLWAFDERGWERDVRPYASELRALPDPELVRPRYTQRQVVVLERR